MKCIRFRVVASHLVDAMLVMRGLCPPVRQNVFDSALGGWMSVGVGGFGKWPNTPPCKLGTIRRYPKRGGTNTVAPERARGGGGQGAAGPTGPRRSCCFIHLTRLGPPHPPSFPVSSSPLNPIGTTVGSNDRCSGVAMTIRPITTSLTRKPHVPSCLPLPPASQPPPPPFNTLPVTADEEFLTHASCLGIGMG